MPRKQDIFGCIEETYYQSLPKWIKFLRYFATRLGFIKFKLQFKQRQLDFKWKKLRGHQFQNTEHSKCSGDKS